MTAKDALRKVQLLANVRESRGYTRAEAQSANDLSQRLIRQFQLAPISQRPSLRPRAQSSWDAWRELADHFGLRLKTFGKRGSIAIAERQHAITVRLDNSEWTAKKLANGIWQTFCKGTEVESLRGYLSANVTPNYSFFRARA